MYTYPTGLQRIDKFYEYYFYYNRVYSFIIDPLFKYTCSSFTNSAVNIDKTELNVEVISFVLFVNSLIHFMLILINYVYETITIQFKRQQEVIGLAAEL